jgi:hypothetical protein
MCPITPQKPKKNCLTCFEKLQFNDQITVKDVNDVLEKNPIPDGCKGADHWLHHLICKSSVGSIQGFVDLLSNPPPFNWQQHAAEKKAKKQQRGTGFRSSSQLQWRLRQPHLPCSQLRRQQQQQQLHLPCSGCWVQHWMQCGRTPTVLALMVMQALLTTHPAAWLWPCSRRRDGVMAWRGGVVVGNALP